YDVTSAIISEDGSVGVAELTSPFGPSVISPLMGISTCTFSKSLNPGTEIGDQIGTEKGSVGGESAGSDCNRLMPCAARCALMAACVLAIWCGATRLAIRTGASAQSSKSN